MREQGFLARNYGLSHLARLVLAHELRGNARNALVRIFALPACEECESRRAKTSIGGRGEVRCSMLERELVRRAKRHLFPPQVMTRDECRRPLSYLKRRNKAGCACSYPTAYPTLEATVYSFSKGALVS